LHKFEALLAEKLKEAFGEFTRLSSRYRDLRERVAYGFGLAVGRKVSGGPR
jgi:hypothetical protein